MWASTKPALGAGIRSGHPLAQGLICAYELQEGGGLVTRNSVNNNPSATFTSPLNWAVSQKGIALQGDGLTGYADCPGHKVGVCTQEIEIIPVGIANVGLCDMEEAGTPGTYDRSIWIGGTSLVGWYIYDGSSKIATSTTTCVTGAPMHIVGTADGSNSNIYINGRLEGQIAAGPAYSGFVSPQLMVGRGHDNSSVLLYANSYIVRARCWARALTASEVLALYTNPYCFLQSPNRVFYSLPSGNSYAYQFNAYTCAPNVIRLA